MSYNYKDLQEIISPKFTEKTLQDIVTKKSKLSEVKVNKIEIGGTSKKGDSYLSNVCRFVLEASGKNEKGTTEEVSIPVIVKYFPKNLARRKTYRSADFFENEVIFYQKVWEPLQEFQNSTNAAQKFDNIPLLLASCIDGENDFVGLLDVSPEGFASPGRGAGLDRIHTVAILRLLGGFHGLSLAFKDQQPEKFEAAASSLKETYFAEKFRPWYSKFQEKAFDIFRDALSKELPAEYLDRFNKFLNMDVYGTLCKACKVRGPLATVTHGDVWVPNFLIKYEGDLPGKITMIDFQLTRYTTLVNDITFFLYACVDFKLVEEDFDGLIEEYHKSLVESLVNLGSSANLVTLEDLHKEIKTWNVFGIGMSIEALIMALLDDDDVSDLDGIQGSEAVPLESVWLIHPFKEQEKRKKLAAMIKFAVDRNLI